jgi:hypothetical protein
MVGRVGLEDEVGRPVAIGMMRANRKPGVAALAVAHAAIVQRAELTYFNPPDVDLKAESLHGWTYDGGGWKRVHTRLPDVIINDLSSIKYRHIWNALQERVPFTSPPIGDKIEIMRRMQDGGFYAELQIPTEPLPNLQSLTDLLDQHERVVLKPHNSSQGRNVYFLERTPGGYRANFGSSWTDFSPSQLAAFFASYLENRGFIGQRYIETKTNVGLPFDIRIHARRTRNGHWETLRVYPRIGSGRTITANYSSGGSIAELRSFLADQFGDRSEFIRKMLLDLAREMPPRFQNLYSDRIVDAVGIDIGLDPTGQPWLFEVNAFPWTKFFELEAAIRRVGYAIHLAEQARENRGGGLMQPGK